MLYPNDDKNNVYVVLFWGIPLNVVTQCFISIVLRVHRDEALTRIFLFFQVRDDVWALPLWPSSVEEKTTALPFVATVGVFEAASNKVNEHTSKRVEKHTSKRVNDLPIKRLRINSKPLSSNSQIMKRERNREYYRMNRAKILKKRLAHKEAARQRNCHNYQMQEARRRVNHQYYQMHKEEARQYYQMHKEKAYQHNRQHYQARREDLRERNSHYTYCRFLF